MMEVKEEQFQSICRTCLSERDNMKDVFNVADVLMTCAPIQIEQGDGLPTTICTECVSQVNQFYEFRLLCEQSDNILRKKLIKQHLVLIKTDGYENEPPEICIENSNSPELNVDERQAVPFNKFDYDKETILQYRKTRKRGCSRKRSPSIIREDTLKQELNEDTKFISSSESSSEEENDQELCCKFCDMKFRYKIRLKKHEQKHLTGLKCHLCDKTFSTVKQLTNHINIHSRKGSHLCQTCGKQFTLPENLVRHQRIHNGVKPYSCHICNKSFIQSNELKSHLITHTAEKHHLCSICGNKYARLISLRVHMRRIHSMPPNLRPYICAVCGRNFKDRRDLSQHMLIHTGERSHVCGVCGKAFNRNSNLRVHERIHSGHKPHVCPVCQRAFIQKHVLITHMRTHPHQQQQGPS